MQIGTAQPRCDNEGAIGNATRRDGKRRCGTLAWATVGQRGSGVRKVGRSSSERAWVADGRTIVNYRTVCRQTMVRFACRCQRYSAPVQTSRWRSSGMVSKLCRGRSLSVDTRVLATVPWRAVMHRGACRKSRRITIVQARSIGRCAG